MMEGVNGGRSNKGKEGNNERFEWKRVGMNKGRRVEWGKKAMEGRMNEGRN
jgi:hypothetical protein